MATGSVQSTASLLHVEDVDIGIFELSPYSVAGIENYVTKTGYTPIGIVGIPNSESGSNNMAQAIWRYYIRNNSIARIDFRNVTTNSATIHVVLSILYLKNPS